MAAFNPGMTSEIIDPVTITFTFECSTATIGIATAITTQKRTYTIPANGALTIATDTWKTNNSISCFANRSSGTMELEIFHEGAFVPFISSLAATYAWLTVTYTNTIQANLVYKTTDVTLFTDNLKAEQTFFIRLRCQDKWAAADLYQTVEITFKHECYTNVLSTTGTVPASFTFVVPAAGSGASSVSHYSEIS